MRIIFVVKWNVLYWSKLGRYENEVLTFEMNVVQGILEFSITLNYYSDYSVN